MNFRSRYTQWKKIGPIMDRYSTLLLVVYYSESTAESNTISIISIIIINLYIIMHHNYLFIVISK